MQTFRGENMDIFWNHTAVIVMVIIECCSSNLQKTVCTVYSAKWISYPVQQEPEL